eukprot:Gb_35668 [translate_table: standard]
MATAMAMHFRTALRSHTVVAIKGWAGSISSGMPISARARAKQKNSKLKLKNEQSRNHAKGFAAKQEEVTWTCVKGCGACCKLDKGPSFPSPEEIFDDPVDVTVSPSPPHTLH